MSSLSGGEFYGNILWTSDTFSVGSGGHLILFDNGGLYIGDLLVHSGGIVVDGTDAGIYATETVIDNGGTVTVDDGGILSGLPLTMVR